MRRRKAFLAVLAGLALAWTGSGRADELADAKKGLAELGIRVLGNTLTLADETGLSKSLRDVAKLKKSLLEATRGIDRLNKEVEATKKSLGELKAQYVQLNAQLANVNPNNVALNNTLVGRVNAVVGEMDLGNDHREKLDEEIKAAQKELVTVREAFLTHILDMRKLADRISEDYATKAKDAEVEQALVKLNAASGKTFELVVSKTFQSSLKRLEALEGDVLTESIPLRHTPGNSLLASVVINGKHTHEMIVDSGASIICLPRTLAAECGIDPDKSSQPIAVKLADGRQVSAQLMTLDSVRVGQFTIENVECAVLGPEAVSAEPLLGMSFLGNFKFELDAQAAKLTLVKVAPDGARPPRGPKPNAR